MVCSLCLRRFKGREPLSTIHDQFKKIHSLFSELTQSLAAHPIAKDHLIKLFSEIIQLESSLKNSEKKSETSSVAKNTSEKIESQRYQQIKSILLESDLNRLLNFAVDSIISMTHADRGFIASLTPASELDFYIARKIGSQEIEDPTSQISKTILRETLTAGKAQHIEIDSDSMAQKYQTITNLHVGSVLSFPIGYEGKYIGILYLDKDSSKPPFESPIIKDLFEFCQLLAPKIFQLQQSKELEQLKTEFPTTTFKFSGVIGHSDVFSEVIRLTHRVATSSATVLIMGESGTGKELIAKAIHENSTRPNGPFVAINCSAIPADLMESELFGYEKGAFTGALQKKPGKFELAHGGTLFLDEIGDMSLNLQSKLLRIIQEKQVDILGGKHPLPIDVRIIAATNKNLKLLVETQQFREDLYYRLNVISIHLPPLRNRKMDIQLIAQELIKKLEVKSGFSGIVLDEKALTVLYHYDWPGNIRELENVLERAIILSDGHKITLKELPAELHELISDEPDVNVAIEGELNFEGLVADYKQDLVNRALQKANGNKSHAAKILGISRNYLHQLLNK